MKLLLMEGNGAIVNIVSKEYPLYFPHPGWSEQKPEDWYVHPCQLVRDIIFGKHDLFDPREVLRLLVFHPENLRRGKAREGNVRCMFGQLILPNLVV